MVPLENTLHYLQTKTCENIELTVHVSKNCDPLFSLITPF